MNIHEPVSAVADMQRRGMRNALAFGRATTGMFERLARQNYAVMGDVVDYTLAQLRIPTVHADPRSALEARAARTRAAVEKARQRATEYAAIASEMRAADPSAAAVVRAVRGTAPTGAVAEHVATTAVTTVTEVASSAKGPAKPAERRAMAKRSTASAKAGTQKKKVATKKPVTKQASAKKRVARKTAAKRTAAGKAAPTRGGRGKTG